MKEALVDLSLGDLVKSVKYVTLDELSKDEYVKRPCYNQIYSSDFGLVPLQENVRCVIYDMDMDSKFRFLILHASGKDYNQPPQGKVEFYETFRDAAVRETFEETGLESFMVIDGMEESSFYFRSVEGVRTLVYSKAFAITADMTQKVTLSEIEGHDYSNWADYLESAEMLLRYPEPIAAVDAVRNNLLTLGGVKKSYRRDFRS